VNVVGRVTGCFGSAAGGIHSAGSDAPLPRVSPDITRAAIPSQEMTHGFTIEMDTQ